MRFAPGNREGPNPDHIVLSLHGATPRLQPRIEMTDAAWPMHASFSAK